jgi:hypothetical protein
LIDVIIPEQGLKFNNHRFSNFDTNSSFIPVSETLQLTTRHVFQTPIQV